MLVESRDERIVEVAVGTAWSTGDSGEWYRSDIVVDASLSNHAAGIIAENIALERDAKHGCNILFVKTLTIYSDDMMELYWENLDD